ncbi:FAD-binding domain-containing protein OS=Streptomyces antimycoticus OX=68175 GN=SANT12839_010730 PE=4 SV=1 [Streptomyces antimycoticus]
MTFRGARRTFDLVIGADGIHSHTRGLAFGPEEPDHRYLGHSFAGFTMPNHLGLAHEGRTWNVPGRTAVLYAPRDGDRVHAFLSFLRPAAPRRLPRPRRPARPRGRDVRRIRMGDPAHGRRPARQRRPLLRRGQPDPYATVVHRPGRPGRRRRLRAVVLLRSGLEPGAGRRVRPRGRAGRGPRPCRCLREVRAHPAVVRGDEPGTRHRGKREPAPRTPEDLAALPALRDPSPVLNSRAGTRTRRWPSPATTPRKGRSRRYRC